MFNLIRYSALPLRLNSGDPDFEDTQHSETASTPSFFTLRWRQRTTRGTSLCRLLGGQSFQMVCPRGVTLQGEGSPRGGGRIRPHVAALSKEVIQLCFNTIAHPGDD